MNNLIGISINHNTAPIEIREALHLNKDEITGFIPKLKSDIFQEGFVLSTCNRTEIFGIPSNYIVRSGDLTRLLLEHKTVNGISSQNFTSFFSCSAVKHVFNVATGIDSLILGDSQILGQAKESFEISESLGFSGILMKRFFDSTIKVGRRAIKETMIGEGAVTVSYAAIQVVEKIYSVLSNKSALVIGAGDTGELAAIHLRDKEIGKIAIANRTFSKAEILAGKVNGSVITFDELSDHLHEFDIIISATSSNDLIISKNEILTAMKKRRGTPMVLMDIAVPRDIDPLAKNIENVFYNDTDSLKIIVDKNLKNREKEIPKVKKIILEEMETFFGWYNTLEIVPTIKTFREFFEEIRSDELQKIKHKVSDEDYIKLEDMTRRMVGRLLHNPTVKLRELASSGINANETAVYSLIMKELFNLNGSQNSNKEE